MSSLDATLNQKKKRNNWRLRKITKEDENREIRRRQKKKESYLFDFLLRIISLKSCHENRERGILYRDSSNNEIRTFHINKKRCVKYFQIYLCSHYKKNEF